MLNRQQVVLEVLIGHDPIVHQSQELGQGFKVREVVLEQPSDALRYDLLKLDELAKFAILFWFVDFAELCLILISFFLFLILALHVFFILFTRVFLISFIMQDCPLFLCFLLLFLCLFGLLEESQ